MKLIKNIKTKQTILLSVFFVLFFLSYTANVLQVSESNLFHFFERQPEGLVVGRLARSAQDGVFSYGGLTGINYDSQLERTTEQYAADLAAQHNYYITHQELPDSYYAYKSQSGGQGIVFGVVQKILPFDNAKKLMLFRGINALFCALIFVLFAGWVYRAFGFVASLITLLLILFSPWLNMYSHNLWWVLWNFYLPFITMLLLLEKKHDDPKSISNINIFACLFVAVFAKCFFTGFEFITTTLAAAICPVVYYFYIEKKSFSRFIVYSALASFTMIVASLAQMALLITQIKALKGTFQAGINHMVLSFTKRSDMGVESVSYLDIFKTYLQDDVLQLGFLPNNIKFYFGVLLLIILLAGIILYIGDRASRQSKALLLTSVFSIIAPLSWLIVFKQHAFEHPHMDYIIWYMPTLLFGFSLLGVCISKLLQAKSKKQVA